MFPKTKTVIWRDQYDPEQIIIGTETSQQTAMGVRKRRTAWWTMHIDSLLMLTDSGVANRVREADDSEFPMEFELRIALPELEEA